MIKEVANLHKDGVSWKRLEMLGLEYKYVALFLQNKITKAEMINFIEAKSIQFAKRQKTWFQKDKRIKWISAGDGGIEPPPAVLETAVLPLN